MTSLDITKDRYRRPYAPDDLMVLRGPLNHFSKGSRWTLADINGIAQVVFLDESRAINESSLYIEHIEIKQNLRNRGFGRVLYEKLEEFAINIGANWIQLDSEQDVVGFWKKMGFQEVNKINFKNKVCMVKKL
jgi:ribosomal protein S18 acetylase RimI-like enzyme